MAQSPNLHIQEILFRDLTSSDPIRSWKIQIDNLCSGIISALEFKQYVVAQLTRFEHEISVTINFPLSKEKKSQKILEDNLKTKALLNLLLSYPDQITSVRKTSVKHKPQELHNASSLLVPATEGGKQ